MATCTYTVPDKNTSGDNFYGGSICSQALIDYFWNTYGFSGNKDYWDDGFGWEDPCNTDKPLARTFNGCYLLTGTGIVPEAGFTLASGDEIEITIEPIGTLINRVR